MQVRLTASRRELIERQRGVIARWQLAGCPSDVLVADGLLRSDRWQPLYRGVYATHTGRPSRPSLLWAAVLRCGPEAVLSHHSAAELDRLADEPASAIFVTLPIGQRVSIARSELAGGLPPIVSHRSLRLAAARHPARTPPRTRIEETVLDLVNVSTTFDEAFDWLTKACGRRLTTPWQLTATVAQRGRLRWRVDVLGALEEIEDGVTSALEQRFIRNVERPHGLPKPQRQARHRRGDISAYLDNYYAEQLVAVELDGLAAHPPETHWGDVHRGNQLTRRGIVTLRYSWADVTQHACRVAAEIADVLRERGWTGRIRRCPACPAQPA